MFIVDSIIEYFRCLFCKHDWEVYCKHLSDGIMDKLGANGEPQERVQMCKKCQEVTTVTIIRSALTTKETKK
jgi:hypothetical protein